jgi:hypothetical protein
MQSNDAEISLINKESECIQHSLFLFLGEKHKQSGFHPETLPLFVKSGAKTSYIGSV